MDEKKYPQVKSHGDGTPPWCFRFLGANTVFENGVLVFHPENITIGSGVYVGHQTILKGYFKNEMIIGDGCWIGPQCFFHSAGNLIIGKNVGIGPGVKIITSTHDISVATDLPIMKRPLVFDKVVLGDGCDIGVNALILPGVTLGNNVQVGAGAVVTRSFPDRAVIAGLPARLLHRM
jgi:acetyltransferase-like isoleucine patch superfamily enzyme